MIKNLGYFIWFLFLFVFVNCKNHISDKNEEKKSISSENGQKSKFLNEESLKKYVVDADILKLIGNLPSPFDTLHFDKVIAYEFDGSGGRKIFNPKNGFSHLIENQKTMSEIQVLEFTKLITDSKTYGGVTAACFDPKMAIVFYESEVPVATVEICLDCNYLISSVPISILVEAHENVSKLGITYGFSNEGISGIKELANELDFKYKNYEPYF